VTPRLIVEADGGSRGNPGPAGYGALVKDAVTGEVLAQASEALGRATNNVAEYSGLIAGLREAARIAPGADTEVRMDSKLVVEQMSGRWQIKHPAIRPLAAQARQAARALGRVSYTWVPRERNTRADRLANQAMDAAARGGGGQPRRQAGGGAGGGPRRASRSASTRGDEAGDGDEAGGLRLGGNGGNGDRQQARPRTGPGWAQGRGTPTTTLLLRHGETPLSPEGRFAGRAEVPLTENGARQARLAAARLAARGGIKVIVTSPLERTRRTADAVAAATGAPVVTDGAFLEMDFGDWEGLSYAEATQRWPEEMAAWVAGTDVAPPGGESIAATSRRVLPALQRLVAAHPAAGVLIVSHVTPIKAMLVEALQAPPVAFRRIHIGVASLSEIDWYPDGVGVVHSLGDTAHLDMPGEAGIG
jgi:ribonuclease H / adenosylcobalamin/alpha-ribazole phosphatase